MVWHGSAIHVPLLRQGQIIQLRKEIITEWPKCEKGSPTRPALPYPLCLACMCSTLFIAGAPGQPVGGAPTACTGMPGIYAGL